jgi:hypothetical protein
MKIILLGLPKSGTMSFQYMFESLGMRSIHQLTEDKQQIAMIIKQNKEDNRPLFTGVEEFDCITELNVCYSESENYWPQIYDFKQIYNENPNALFILNKREKFKILNSFKNWNYQGVSLYDRFLKYNPDIVSENSDEAFLNFIDNHYSKIVSFFEQLPEANFLEFDIEKDNIKKLKVFFDIGNFKKLPFENSRKIKDNKLKLIKKIIKKLYSFFYTKKK